MLTLFALWAWWCRQLFLALVLAAVLIMAGIEALESANLWDYVIDPVIFITYSAQWLAVMARRLRSASVSH